MSRIRIIGEQRMMDDGDIWYEHWQDEETDKAKLEDLKRNGIPLPPAIMQYAIDGTYHRFFEPNTTDYWFDMNGRPIKNHQDYTVSEAEGTKGMPMTKFEVESAKRQKAPKKRR